MPLSASFDSTCSACDAPIFTGDPIDRDPTTDLWVHAECAEAKPLMKPAPPDAEMCPTCGMAASWPVHGNCTNPAVGTEPDPFAHARGEAVPEPPPAHRKVDLSKIQPGQAVEVDGEGEDIVAAWVPEGSTSVRLLPGRPEPERHPRDGRYKLPDPDGKTKYHTRATTVCKAIDKVDMLVAWKERQVAAGIGLREDLYATVSSHRDQNGADRKTYTEVVEKAHEAAGSNDKSRKGTALHRFCEEVDLGRMGIEEVPSIWRGQVMRYRQCLEDNGIRIDPTGVEAIYIDDRYGIAGMGDRRLWLPDYRLPVIGDVKTGSIEYATNTIACQLAIYQDHTATYDLTTKRRGPRVEMDPTIGIVIHLPQDGQECTLYQYSLVRGREHYMVALEVREIQRTKPSEVHAVYHPANVVQPYEWIGHRLMALVPLLAERAGCAAEDVLAHLAEFWPTEVRLPFPVDPTQAELDAMDAFLVPLETELGAPFTVGVAS